MMGMFKIKAYTTHFKQAIAYASPSVGVNDTYGEGVEIKLPQNSIVLYIDVMFDGLTEGELQTVKLEFKFSDGSTGTHELVASSKEGPVVKKQVTAFELYWAMGGSFSLYQGSASKQIVSITAYAKSNLSSTPNAIPYVLVHYITPE